MSQATSGVSMTITMSGGESATAHWNSEREMFQCPNDVTDKECTYLVNGNRYENREDAMDEALEQAGIEQARPPILVTE